MPTHFVFIYHSHYPKDVEGNHQCVLLSIVPEKFYKDVGVFCAIWNNGGGYASLEKQE